jgi:hypothetical protein
MHKKRFLIIPLVMVFLLACGLSNGIQQIVNVATQIPGVLTSMPTALGPMETAAAQQQSASSNCGTPTSGGLGVDLSNAKSVLQLTQQVTFTDGTVDGKPASTATLVGAGASTFPAISNGFSAQFIGDPCNLSEIKVTIPRTDVQATVDQGIGALNIMFSVVLPPSVQLSFLTWLTENYANVQVGSQLQTTSGNMQFTLQRSQTDMTLDVLPMQ